MACSLEELDGLSSDFVERLEKVEGKEQTHRYVSMKYPEIVPALSQVKDEKVRAKLQAARSGMVQDKNGPILDQLIEKRRKLAELLGYDSFSRYVLEPSMAKDPETVQQFKQDMARKLLPIVERETSELRELKR